MYLVSKESNGKCSDLQKVDVRRQTDGRADGRTPDKSVSDKVRLTKVSGAKNAKPRHCADLRLF